MWASMRPWAGGAVPLPTRVRGGGIRLPAAQPSSTFQHPIGADWSTSREPWPTTIRSIR
jgi:hypothetical protein